MNNLVQLHLGWNLNKLPRPCLPWAETFIPVYLLFASLVLEPNPQVWPLDCILLHHLSLTRFPVTDLIPWESHIHSWKPVPTTSVLTYPQNPSLLSASRPVEHLFLLPSPLARLTLQGKTDLTKWLKSHSWAEYPLLIKCDFENRKNNLSFHSKNIHALRSEYSCP